MPTATAKASTYNTDTNGCGPCQGSQKSGGTCSECNTEQCNAMKALKCVKGNNGTAAAEDCPLTATTCHMPKFTKYVGLASGQTYGCGVCPANSAAKCEVCSG